MAETIALQVTGMHCASCVGRAEAALKSQPGVLSAVVNLATGSAQVAVAGASGHALAKALTAAGYPAEVRSSVSEQHDFGAEARSFLNRFLIALALTLPVFVLEMGGHLYPPFHHAMVARFGQSTLWMFQFVLISLVLFGPGRLFFDIGFRALLRGAPEMNALVALGAGAAWVYSTLLTFAPTLLPEGTRAVYFEAAGVIVTLILLGRALEARAKGRAGAAITALIGLQPDTALVVENGQATLRRVSEVGVADTLRARPGDRIAVDGIVTDGAADIDEAMLTGEPLPRHASVAAAVSAGTIVVQGQLDYRAERIGAETTLARIVDLVDQAQGGKLPVQAQIDRLTAVFVPIVMVLALSAAVGWLVFGGTLAQALVAAVSVLIIACPCAMGLATPISIVVATGRAAEQGILIRSGETLETLAHARAVAFDKTGTLTRGTPTVLNATLPEDPDTIAALAVLASRSGHPLSGAIATFLGHHTGEVQEFEEIVGQGVTGCVSDQRLALGSNRLMSTLSLDPAPFREIERTVLSRGATPVFAAVDECVVGVFEVTDSLKDDAKSTIDALHSAGLQSAILSGDREAAVRNVAEELGITTAHAELLPDTKLDVVREMQRDGAVVFVGDGINDAPALAQADIGVALGKGTDVAMESANIVLMADKLRGVAVAQRLGQATMRNIRQNLFWAFAYNAALIPVAMGVFYPFFGWQLSPMLGAGAMALSSVFVVMNAQRLRFVI